MTKPVALWSISDYNHSLSFNTDISGFWSKQLEIIKQDPYNAFTSFLSPSKSDIKSSDYTLAGIPIAIKDNLCYKEIPTTCASKMLAEWQPDYNATAIEHLLSEGVMIIGKTNLDEFAMGNTTATSYFGKTFNPWDPYKRFTSGGSSGGSAVAVAMGYVPVALGTDTGGSVRCPASFCGVLGLKPTYGRVSRYGLISYAHTLDQIGINARYAQDLSTTLEIISRPDTKDMTYQGKPFIKQPLEITDPISVGIAEEQISQIPDHQQKVLKDALDLLESKGSITTQPVVLDELDILLPTYYVTAFSEAYSNLVRYTGQQYGFDAGDVLSTRLEGFSEEVQRRFNLGSFSLKTGFEEQLYTKSQKIREYYKEKFSKIFEKVQTIALPTMLDVAFTWDEIQTPVDSYKADLLTVPANLTGIPALSLPVGFTKKLNATLPVGLQFFSNWWQEDLLIQLAYEYQKLTDYHFQLPPDSIMHEE